MKLNIFRIPANRIDPLITKMADVGMEEVFTENIDGWAAAFYFSTAPQPVEIPWVSQFSLELGSLNPKPTNSLYFASYLWRSEDFCLALSFGKAHFYLREFCDNDFGLEMARRIGSKDDVRQKAARRYAGKRKKEIRSYLRETQLDVESGESIDYLQAATIDKDKWGVTAKFGASMLISPDATPSRLPQLFGDVQKELQNEARFQLPRIEEIKDDSLISRYDRELARAILSEAAEFEESSHQLVGVDFVFSGNEEYYFQYYSSKSQRLSRLEICDLRDFIQDHSIREDKIFKIKLRVVRDESREYSQELKKCLDYSIDHARVFLQNGKWVEFNRDYDQSLNNYIDEAIEIDHSHEPTFASIKSAEPEFNDSLTDHGYDYADKNFDIIRIKGYKIEAWDLKKDGTVYAVKFGKPQDLGYVCDQAVNVLEIYRNNPAAFKNLKIDSYCLWLVMERKYTISKLSDLRSIIFKQKLDDWARKCWNMGIKPSIRVSLRKS
jgi:uncharacterized protein (TIGR04141 family)